MPKQQPDENRTDPHVRTAAHETGVPPRGDQADPGTAVSSPEQAPSDEAAASIFPEAETFSADEAELESLPLPSDAAATPEVP